jgi:ribosomal protein S19E (S16A)
MKVDAREILRKEPIMKFGHVSGTKKERRSTNANWWYQTEEAQAILRKLEEEERTKQAVAH